MSDLGRLRVLARRRLLHAALAGVVLLLNLGVAQAVDLLVQGSDGTSIAQYRWTLEEDASYHVDPATNSSDPDTLSVIFHPSYMPVVASGDETAPLPTNLDSTKYYYVSVIPKVAGSWAIGGAQFKGGDTSVTVIMNALPLPTAQIKVFVFEDNNPINNVADLPEERGLPGVSLVLEDAGGRYGISAGTEMTDAYGNPLGSVYSAVPGNGKCAKGQMLQSLWDTLDHSGDRCVAMGDGVIVTDVDGVALIKNLSPGKYGITAIPPAGQGWVQTSTIEGTHIIDAWVAANEPPYFQEFGPPGPHVSIGFVNLNPRPANPVTGDPGNLVNSTAALNGTHSISGTVVNLHMSRPPDYTFYDGGPLDHTTIYVGLNQGAAGAGPGIYVGTANADGHFTINDVPPGDYQLAIWDEALDVIFASKGVTVGADGSCTDGGGPSCDLADIPVFQWFTRQHHYVFADMNGNGFRDPGEMGIPDQNINIRWRDGTINQAAPTDGEGFVPFDEAFPFFAWQVAEVDYLRWKPTGVTVTVDNGGYIDLGNPALSWDGLLAPQPQCVLKTDGSLAAVGYDPATGQCPPGSEAKNPNTGNNLSRTEKGPALLEGFQGFIGQTSILEWGKQPWGPGENGGIAGIVYYSTTRAEDDPRYGAAEPWEPGIPRVQVNLYRDIDPKDGVPDDTNGSGLLEYADVDNPPLGWSDGGAKGAEDIDWNGNGAFDLGDALDSVHTDSWDDSPPTGCQGEKYSYKGKYEKDCYDGLRNFNQVRPAVFDGGYAFGFLLGKTLAAGTYIVQAVPPPGYEIVKEEDKNVDFGETYKPSALALPPACVGAPHTVPAQLDLFPGVDSAFAGHSRPLCDMKQVVLSTGQNAAADFYLFTKAPIAGHIYGFILDDTANEFDPGAPNFGEKYAPPNLPISVRDWTGREVSRTYSDAYGVYSTLVPSTYTASQPKPSGMAPNMMTVCLNSPFMPNPDFVAGGTLPELVQDPYFNRQYSQFCYTLQYMPGTTTYLDTPVIPVAAMAGPGGFPLDCQLPDGSPMIYAVTNAAEQGPWIGTNRTLAITSMGTIDVANPDYNPSDPVCLTAPSDLACQQTIPRDYGFGTDTGEVWIGSLLIPASNISWGADTIVATVPANATTGQLTVKRANGKVTIAGVTVTVDNKKPNGNGTGGPTPPITVAKDGLADYTSIQAAIDAAKDSDLITVAPGDYEELVIMWHPVRLQGWGAGSTRINAVKSPAYKLQYWRDKVSDLVLGGAVDLLPSQEVAAAAALEPVILFSEEGSGILVLGKRNAYKQQQGESNGRIDGFEVTGADHAGGIVINAYAHFLQVSNNLLSNNTGTFGGGIRAGHPNLTADNVTYESSLNDSMQIHHNLAVNNGGLDGVGGGIALYKGCDGYRVRDNFVCGNFTLGEGGGIGHMGVSNLGRIERNWVLYNESFNQGVAVSGGGIFVGGSAPLTVGGLSEGSGSVVIDRNLIEGNLAGAGDGGGIRASQVNGQDVAAAPSNSGAWYKLDILNNIITNNVAGLAGGGIALQDAVKVNIIHNTVAQNDSTATAMEAFKSPTTSAPKPAGIVGRVHSPSLNAAIPTSLAQYKTFSNPQLVSNIVYQNRSFYFAADTNCDPTCYHLFPDVSVSPAAYDDLAVLGVAGQLHPTSSLLTTLTGVHGEDYSGNGNITGDPAFVASYFNTGRVGSIVQPEVTTPTAPPAFDEGGNFIKIRFGPLTLYTSEGVLFRNYHISGSSPAVNKGAASVLGSFPDLSIDFDGDARGSAPDIGADEIPSASIRMLSLDRSAAIRR